VLCSIAEAEVSMLAFRLIPIGDEQGVVLPAVQADRTVLAEETPDGTGLMTCNAAHDVRMQAARRLTREREAVLRELAKR
jgi:hypothetical protein